MRPDVPPGITCYASQLFVRGGRQWAYAGPDNPEFDDDVTHGEYQIRTDGPRSGGAIYQGGKNPGIWLVMAQPPDAWLDDPDPPGITPASQPGRP